MAKYNAEVIYLGKVGEEGRDLEDWDVAKEHYGWLQVAENAGTFDDYSSKDIWQNLWGNRQIAEFNQNHTENTNIYEDSTSGHYLNGTGDSKTGQISFKVNGKNFTDYIDSILTRRVDITYIDGSTSDASMDFVQTRNGHTFVLCHDDQSDHRGVYTEKPIQYVEIVKAPMHDNYDRDWLAAHSYDDNKFATPSVTATCFSKGTMILKSDGEVPVECLKPGDFIKTKDNGFQPIRWIGSKKISMNGLATHPHLRPIRISAGALGDGKPLRNLIVSPQHRILVRSKIAHRLFGTDEVLVAAKHLLAVDGIDIAEDIASVEYFHFLLDSHQIVVSNGAETESMYTGTQALGAIGETARKEILEIFPELQNYDPKKPAPSARPLIAARLGRKMAENHAKNNQPLYRHCCKNTN